MKLQKALWSIAAVGWFLIALISGIRSDVHTALAGTGAFAGSVQVLLLLTSRRPAPFAGIQVLTLIDRDGCPVSLTPEAGRRFREVWTQAKREGAAVIPLEGYTVRSEWI